MKKSAIVIGALLIALVVMFMLQRQAQTALRQQNDSLRAQLEQSQNDNASLSNSLAQKQNAQSSPDDSRELARLRNQVGMLRQQTNELGKLQAESYRSQTTTAPAPAGQVSPADLFQLDQFHRLDALKEVGVAMYQYAADNNQQFPTNFDQLTPILGGVTNFEGGITLDSFEFMNAGLASQNTPTFAIFREKTPRQTLDGKWIRIYGMADGSVQTRISADGNFDEIEKQYSPPPP